jgi:hypothetical protein
MTEESRDKKKEQEEHIYKCENRSKLESVPRYDWGRRCKEDQAVMYIKFSPYFECGPRRGQI